MPTVIDALVVTLGLDPRQFTEGERDALSSFKKTKEGVESYSKSIEASGAKISDIFATVKKGAVGVLGAFVGEQAVAFVSGVAASDAAISRLSKTIGINIENLSTWQGMVRQMGGAATDATSTLGALTDAISQVQSGGGSFNGTFATLLNRSGEWRGKTADQGLRQISKYLSEEMGAGRMSPQVGRMFAESIPGINESMMNLIMRGPAALDEFAEAARRAGIASKDSGEEAEDFQKKEAQLTSSLENLARYVFPALTASVDLLLIPLKAIGAIFSGEMYKANDARAGIKNDRGFWYDFVKAVVGPKAAEETFGASAGAGASGTGAGTTRGDRNNNPGNIEYGAFAIAHGATGSDGRFAKFPTKTAGEVAMADLLHSAYSGQTLAQIVQKWTNGADPSYLQSVMRATGLGANDIPNLNDPAVVAKLMSGMMGGEGTHGAGAATFGAGGGGGGNTTSHRNDVHIGMISLTSTKANPKDVAQEIPDAIRRMAMAIPANSGQV